MVEKSGRGSNAVLKTDGSSQKKSHRRSPWACDECRLRKRKCDGSHPCQPCRSLETECGYRSRRPALTPTQRIRLLEQHLRHTVSFLQELPESLPRGVDVDVRPVLGALRYWSSDTEPLSPTTTISAGEDEGQRSQLCSMLAGCNRLISPAPWKSSFYGALSEVSFILRTLELFDRGAYSPQRSLGPATDIFNMDHAAITADLAVGYTRLPDKQTTLHLVRPVFDRSHAFISFLHEQHFRSMVDFVYDQYNSAEEAYVRFLPLLHHVIALGYLSSRTLHQDRSCSFAVSEATKHFETGQQLLDASRCGDLVSLQAFLCGASFLISTSRLAAAHALIGLATSSATRLGLHRLSASHTGMMQDEREIRVLVFAALIKLDLYVSLILDLPRFIQDEFVDACLQNIDEVFSGRSQLGLSQIASTKHLELLCSTCTARQAVFVKATPGESIEAVDSKRLAEVEAGLHRWTREVSALLLPLGEGVEFAMLRYDLEMACNFTQITLYRPFLHYLRVMADSKTISRAQSRHALACIKLASTTILRSEAMSRDHPNLPLSWESCYTLFLAVMCLVFLISAHNGTSQPSEAWRRASVGIRILYANVCVNDCASACLKVLKMVVRQLNHTVDFDFDQIEKSTSLICRSGATAKPHDLQQHHRPPATADARLHVIDTPMQAEDPRPSSPVIEERFANADNVLAHAEDLPLGFGFTDLLNLDMDDERFG